MSIISRNTLMPSLLLDGPNFGDFFPSIWSGLRRPEAEIGPLIPRVDIEEEKDCYLIIADMPGIQKDDIDLELSNGVLTINSQYDDLSEEKEGIKVIRRERRSGRYFRSFNVGKDVTEKMITANFSDGVLKLKVPKSNETEPEAKRIKIH